VRVLFIAPRVQSGLQIPLEHFSGINYINSSPNGSATNRKATMYYITSKTVVDGKRDLITQVESRADARIRARELNGTVRTQAEFDDMVAAGEIATAPNVVTPTAEQEVANDFPTTETVTEGPVQTMDQLATEEEERVMDEMVEEEEKVNPILAAAQRVADAPKVKRTVGVKEKAEPKRRTTTDETMAAAGHAMTEFAKTNPTKVQIVRFLAAWNGNALQRRDVFKLVKGFIVNLEIADATISTQFQLVRSGKAPAGK
jgi:hypothetical protein